MATSGQRSSGKSGSVEQPLPRCAQVRNGNADRPGETAEPDAWVAVAPRKDGLWWPEWVQWLATHSMNPGAPPEMGARGVGYAPLGTAPGTYVMQE